jgi:hypothetical protein
MVMCPIGQFLPFCPPAITIDVPDGSPDVRTSKTLISRHFRMDAGRTRARIVAIRAD